MLASELVRIRGVLLELASVESCDGYLLRLSDVTMSIFACIDQASVGIVEKWGKFSHVAQAGFQCFNPLAGVWLAGTLSLRTTCL